MTNPKNSKNIDIKKLGLVSYDDAEQLMRELHGQRVAGFINDTLLVLQHHPVITRGRQLKDVSIDFDPMLKTMGVEIRHADRGGLLTYHGPGQIVVYFILKVQDYFKGVGDMVRAIEDTLIDFLKSLNVAAGLKESCPGIWVGGKKIGSVGFRIARDVTTHGIALNVVNGLEVYNHFKPCGLLGSTMTNLREVSGRDDLNLEDLSNRLATRLERDLQERAGGTSPL